MSFFFFLIIFFSREFLRSLLKQILIPLHFDNCHPRRPCESMRYRQLIHHEYILSLLSMMRHDNHHSVQQLLHISITENNEWTTRCFLWLNKNNNINVQDKHSYRICFSKHTRISIICHRSYFRKANGLSLSGKVT